MKLSIPIFFAGLLAFSGCGLLSEGEPVTPESGIAAKWQSDADPGRIMEFKAAGQGHYSNSEKGIDQNFRYAFTDEDTIKVTFRNGQSMDLDVRTTTLYLWVTNEQGTERFHKYE